MTSNTSADETIHRQPSTDSITIIDFILTRVVAVLVIMFLGIVGNGFVLNFYGRNKKMSGQVYILAMAVIDLVSCVVILPQESLV